MMRMAFGLFSMTARLIGRRVPAALVILTAMAVFPETGSAQAAPGYRIVGIRAYKMSAEGPSIDSIDGVQATKYQEKRFEESQRGIERSPDPRYETYGYGTSRQILLIVDVENTGVSMATSEKTMAATVTVDAREGTTIYLQETRRKYYLYTDRQSIPFVIDEAPCTRLSVTASITVGTKVSRLVVPIDNNASECSC